MSSESCPAMPITLSQICENVIAIDPWDSSIIRQEQRSRPGCRVHFDHLREMMHAAFNLGAADKNDPPTIVLKWVIECQAMLTTGNLEGIRTNLTMIEQQLNEGAQR